MTGIAVGLLNIHKIAVGNTEILKVSVGSTAVWPGGPTSMAFVNSLAAGLATLNYATLNPQAGDLIVYLQWGAGTVVIPSFVPTGFSQLYRQVFTPGNQAVMAACAAIFVSGVTQTSIPEQVQTNLINSHAVLIFRGNAPFTAFEQFVNTASLVAGDPTAIVTNLATANRSGPTSVLIAQYCSDATVGNSGTFGGVGPAINLNLTTLHSCKYLVAPPTTGTNTVDLPQLGTANGVNSFILRGI